MNIRKKLQAGLLAASLSVLSMAAMAAEERVTGSASSNAGDAPAVAGQPSASDARRLAAAVNQVPGVKVKPEDLETEKKGGFPNPVGWLFKPITQLQKQSIRLQQQIMKLEGPIAAMQPTMLGLRDQMVSVERHMSKVEGRMSGVEIEMKDVQGAMGQVKDDVERMRQLLSRLQGPITRLETPIRDLKEPVVGLQRPISSVHGQLTDLRSQLDEVEREIRTTSNFMFLAILFAALLVAVGTPVAGLLVWWNRRKLFGAQAGKQ
jgi:archaellum component FlaC